MCIVANFCVRIKVPKFRTKNAFIKHFGLEFKGNLDVIGRNLEKLFHIWNHYCICLILNNIAKKKKGKKRKRKKENT